jgi:predicted secreted protein
MTATSAIAIYFVVWWLCLFIVLPFGVRNAQEAGETAMEGHEAGAPVNPMLVKKALATTILASLVFAAIYGQVTYGWIAFEDVPFLGSMPKG